MYCQSTNHDVDYVSCDNICTNCVIWKNFVKQTNRRDFLKKHRFKIEIASFAVCSLLIFIISYAAIEYAERPANTTERYNNKTEENIKEKTVKPKTKKELVKEKKPAQKKSDKADNTKDDQIIQDDLINSCYLILNTPDFKKLIFSFFFMVVFTYGIKIFIKAMCDA